MPLCFATETAKCSQICAVPIASGGKCAQKKTVSNQLITPCMMDVKARHVNDYI